MLNLEFWDDDFFKIPPKRLKVEQEKNVGRVHIMDRGRIVAVATLEKPDEPSK